MSAKLNKVVKPEWAARVLGIDYADLPKLDQATRYIDPARIHLPIATRCSEADADADHAAWLLWPGSMAAEEAAAERDVW